MTGGLEESDDAFLDAACSALHAPGDGDPLTSLGWWGLLTDLGDLDARTAALALFRAQGRQARTSVALGALIAQPFLAAAGLDPGSLIAAIECPAPHRGSRRVIVGDLDRYLDGDGTGGVEGRFVLVDRPGRGADVFPAEAVRFRPVAAAGGLVLRVLDPAVDPDPSARSRGIDERHARPARERGRFLGRLALSMEILGAAEGALALAVAHARAREQFGRPIGSFQAVRHLLAWAETDRTALASVAATAIELDEAAPARHDEVVKALAGRNGRRICEHALQVLGAIGFTREHTHHTFHGRVLTLDTLLGTSTDLTRALGTWVRESRADPAVPARALLAGSS
jgi:hypothetical protein